MRIFITGANGFIGSALVPELIAADHQVIGLCRSDRGAEELTRAGAEVLRGDVNELEPLRAGTETADAVIHAAFHHDFANLKQSSENDRKVIKNLGKLLGKSDRPLVITSGTGLVRSKSGQPAIETDDHVTSAEFPRAATEEAADTLIDGGVHVIVVRLPQVHDLRRFGRVSEHIKLARQQGRVVYVGEGQNRLPAAHVADVAHLYRLVLENGQAAARYHAVCEEGVVLRDIAEAVGAALALPVETITPDEAPGYFGWLAQLAQVDLAASGAWTREQLGWTCTGPSLLTDLRDMEVSTLPP